MGKGAYRFDPESLSYKIARGGWRRIVSLLCRYLLAGIALAVLSYLVFSLFFYTPQERRLAQENRQLQLLLDSLSWRYARVDTVLQEIEQRDENIYRIIFEAEPVKTPDQELELAVSEFYDRLRTQGSQAMISDAAALLLQVESSLENLSRRFDTIVALVQDTACTTNRIPSIQPLANNELTKFVASFGIRMHPFYKVLREHTGVDFAAPMDTPVWATADGVVKSVRCTQRGYGNMVVIDHMGHYQTCYAHLNQVSVRVGQKLKRGETIATVGSTGMSMAPHLHYEVLYDGKPIDPLNYFFQELPPLQLAMLAKNALKVGQTLD